MQKVPRKKITCCLFMLFIMTLLPGLLAAQPAGFTSVTSYGAVANDGQDDLAAFNAAYAAASVGVYIPAGTFHLSTCWQINRNSIDIIGAGMGSTKLYFMNQGSMNTGILAVTSDVEIAHFYIDSANNTRDGFPGKGIMGTYGNNSRIHDLEIHHCECGMWIGGYSSPLQVTQNMTISNCRIIDNYADGINLCQGTSNCTITNNYLSGNLDDAIALWPNNEYGAPMEVNNIISYNTIENNQRAGGIAIFGGNGHQVFGNTIRNGNRSSGIRFTTDFPGYHFESTSQIRVYNNTLTNVGTASDWFGCSRGAIEINATNAPIQGLLFENNTIINAQRHGVQLGSNSSVTNVVFNGLTINGVGTSGVTSSCFTVPIESFAVMTYGNNGNVTITNLSISNVPSSQYIYQTNPTGFVLNVSYGGGAGTPVPT
ncbi:MAG: right-handed parallel beta-helix repeat-containing protein, partial [Spirochaetales bacterium]|nr:right-handed parallel beta-helix repeat-containing protein [Spirochaetales bacterium]